MNSFSYQLIYPCHFPSYAPRELDWLEMDWGGPYDEDDEEDDLALCGNGLCPGDCYVCVMAEAAVKRISVPIQGPVNKDGIPLGFLLITE
jgi:hypothetical protein